MTQTPGALEPRIRTAILAVLIVTALVRLLHLVEIRDLPAAKTHAWTASDMAVFHEWAGIVAQGDWLTDRVFHPFHWWHELLRTVSRCWLGAAGRANTIATGAWSRTSARAAWAYRVSLCRAGCMLGSPRSHRGLVRHSKRRLLSSMSSSALR